MANVTVDGLLRKLGLERVGAARPDDCDDEAAGEVLRRLAGIPVAASLREEPAERKHAVAMLAEIIRQHDSVWEAHYLGGAMLLLRFDRPEEAIIELGIAIAMRPDDCRPYDLLARALTAAGRHEAADRVLTAGFERYWRVMAHFENDKVLARTRYFARHNRARDLPGGDAPVASHDIPGRAD